MTSSQPSTVPATDPATDPTATAPIAVLGATGAQGGPVARALLDAGRATRVVVRDPARAGALAERGAQVAAADLTDVAALTAAFTGVSGVFAHLPFVPDPAVVAAQAEALAAALEAAGVPLTVFTLSGPRPSAATGVHSFDTKRVAYDTVTSTRAPLIVFTPLTYLANLSAPFTAPGVVSAGELRYPIPAGQRQPWVSVEDQAALAIAALDRPDLAGPDVRARRQAHGPGARGRDRRGPGPRDPLRPAVPRGVRGPGRADVRAAAGRRADRRLQLPGRRRRRGHRHRPGHRRGDQGALDPLHRRGGLGTYAGLGGLGRVRRGSRSTDGGAART
jgi:uncharacterized protein YbjT (DUF2867 family)